MHDDDLPVGRVYSRRELLGFAGAAGLALLAGAAPRRGAATSPAPWCVVRPQQTEGPYFVDARLERSDIRSDPASGEATPGLRLDLGFRVSSRRDGRCALMSGAQVDLWQCDARGVYSDVRDRRFDTTGRRFLRGHQFTDDAGEARFVTIFPGWYPGRTVHLHFKIRTRDGDARDHEFTSQLYFDDALSDRVHAQEPYASEGERNRRNDGDRLFRRSGRQLLLDPREAGDGLAAMFAVALDVD